MKHCIVTIDGPAGVGKTTLAREIAQRLNVGYLDTGAMFRAAAWILGEGAWDWPDEDLEKALAGLRFSLTGCGRNSEIRLGDEVLPDAIRQEHVGLWASHLGRVPKVREALKNAQRAIGRDVSLVAEGRDMGTVVFPQADHKFFLEASPEERARRRWLQLRSKGQDVDLTEISLALKLRDEQDRNRPVAPLRPAPDAVIIDTTDLDLGQVLERILARVKVWDQSAESSVSRYE